MERELVLSSYSVKNKGNNKPSDFVTEFTRNISLDDNKEYGIGLNGIINMSPTCECWIQKSVNIIQQRWR